MNTRAARFIKLVSFREIAAGALMIWPALFSPVAFAQPQPQPQPQSPDNGTPTNFWYEILPPKDSWSRHFRVGLLVGMNINASFNMSGQFSISGGDPGPTGVSGANHFYDDGYVRVDETGNAQGYTSFWGYNNASQYDAAAQTLTMHSSTSFTASGSATCGDAPYIGFDMAYGGNLWRWGSTRIGWELGFGLLPISIADRQSMPANINRAAYSFNTGDIDMPDARYEGGSSGVGPTIQDVATAQTGSLVPGTVSGSRTLDVMLYSVRLGPSFYWELSRRFGLSAGAGPAIGIVSGNLNIAETIVFTDGTTVPNNGEIGSTSVVFGGYVNASLMYHAVPNGDFYIGVQYMPMGSSTISGSGRQATLNLGGQVYFSAGINWPF